MPGNLVPLLEGMSAYLPAIPGHLPNAHENPVCFSYQIYHFASQDLQVVSRIGFAGLDYTGRSNKIAHHLLFESERESLRFPYGAISLCLANDNFVDSWDEPPHLLQYSQPNSRRLNSTYAQQWQSIAGDAGWAGVVAEVFVQKLYPNFYLEFPLGTPVQVLLELVAEVARLLPQEYLPKFTFSTYFSQGGNNSECFLRFCLPEMPLLVTAKRMQTDNLFCFCEPKPMPLEWENSALVHGARHGILEAIAVVTAAAAPLAAEQDTPLPVATVVAEALADASYPKTDRLSQAGVPAQEAAVQAPTSPPLCEKTAGKNFLLRKAIFLLLVSCLLFGCLVVFYLYQPSATDPVLELLAQQEDSGGPTPVVKPETVSLPEVALATTSSIVAPVSAKPGFVAKIEDEFKLFRAWRQGLRELPLPASLTSADAARLILTGIDRVKWSADWATEVYQEDRDRQELRVLPLRATGGGASKMVHRAFPGADPAQTLRLSWKNLLLIFPEAEADLHIVTHKNIREICLCRGSDLWSWKPLFRPEYIELCQMGRLSNKNWLVRYQESQDEKEFAEFLEISIGDCSLDKLHALTLPIIIARCNSAWQNSQKAKQDSAEFAVSRGNIYQQIVTSSREQAYTSAKLDEQLQKIRARLDKLKSAAAKAIKDQLDDLLTDFRVAVELLYAQAGQALLENQEVQYNLGVADLAKEMPIELDKLLKNCGQDKNFRSAKEKHLQDSDTLRKNLPVLVQKHKLQQSECNKAEKEIIAQQDKYDTAWAELNQQSQSLGAGDFFVEFKGQLIPENPALWEKFQQQLFVTRQMRAPKKSSE